MATVTFPDKSTIAALGPLKLEFVELTGVSDEDTYTSKLVSPRWSLIVGQGDRGGLPQQGSCTLDGKEVTLHNPTGVSTTYLLIIGGF